MSDCLPHLHGCKEIPNVSPSDPIAACKECGALACNQHGQRDSSKPAFICIECDPTLLVKSAMSGTQSEPGDDGGGGRPVPESSSGDADVPLQTFITVDEFLSQRPAYERSWFGTGMDEIRWLRDQAAMIVGGDEDRTDLILAAVALALLLEIPQTQLPPEIRSLVPQRAVGEI